MDVETEGNRDLRIPPQWQTGERVLATKVEDGTGGHILVHDDVASGTHGSLLGSSSFLHLAFGGILTGSSETAYRMNELNQIGVIGCLLTLEEQVRVELQLRDGLPGKDKVGRDGRGVVVIIDVGGIDSCHLVGKVEINEVRLEGADERE